MKENLGVDRLDIVSIPGAQIEDPDQVALQVGKYLTKGIMVSYTQGMEEGSNNIIVEVDLKHGFVFQAETQQEQEQGKFTIKWNLNY